MDCFEYYFSFFLFFCIMTKHVNYWVFSTTLLLFSMFKLTAQTATVKIEQDSTIAKLMATKIEFDSKNYASNFYTIQLYYGDNKRAQELHDDFKNKFPDWEIDLSFETPNYKVQVGRYKNYYNGLKKLMEVKQLYPAAFLLEIKN